MKSWQRNELVDEFFNSLEDMMKAKIKLYEETKLHNYKMSKIIREEELNPAKEKAKELFKKLEQTNTEELRKIFG